MWRPTGARRSQCGAGSAGNDVRGPQRARARPDRPQEEPQPQAEEEERREVKRMTPHGCICAQLQRAATWLRAASLQGLCDFTVTVRRSGAAALKSPENPPLTRGS